MAQINGKVQAVHLVLRSVILVAGFVTRGERNTLMLLFRNCFLSWKGVLTKVMRELAWQRIAVRRYITGVLSHRDGEWDRHV